MVDMEKTDTMTDQFKQEVRHALVTLNRSAAQLSKEAGLGVNYVNQMFRGVSPTLDQVGKIRAAIQRLNGGSDAS